MSESVVEPTGADDQFRLLVQAITDYAIYRLDTAGIVASWNSGAEQATGYSPSDILGQHVSLFFTPESKADSMPARALATAGATGRFADEGWLVRKNGTRFWASIVIDPVSDEHGDLVGFAVITRDVTSRRAAQDALRSAERRSRLLMDSVVDYAILTLDPEGFVTSWNVGAERTKGYTKDEILGRNFSLFYTPDDQAAGRPALALAAARADNRFEDEGWRVRKDGTRFWASIVVEPMWGDDGQLIGFAKIARDITEKRAVEEAKEQLYQAQKMETVGQLTGGVAHDFNNLLSVVMGSLELISRINDDDRIERLIQTAQRAAERGAKLIDQLLAFSRRQVLRPQVANINDLIMAFDALLRHAGGEFADLQLQLGSELWLTDVDQTQFQSALLNLVVNARDAIAKGGSLTITTRNTLVDQEAAAALTEIAPGPYVVVTVQDTGEGMSPEVKARVTEPFYSTKDVGRGSGLGLSQVYGFARQSDGQIAIQSEAGRGTSVSIYLPKSAKLRADATDMAARSNEIGQGTVLVVEDNPDLLEVAINAVRSFGYEAIAARDASAALQILQRDQSVDLLFTDVVIPPGMSGVELAGDARRLRPALRVLLTSGYPRDALQVRKAAEENMAFIAKPYTPSALGERLGTLRRGEFPIP